ncbi:MAG: SAM-dependent methyltransferase, partial [Sinimarinibacterium sp.]
MKEDDLDPNTELQRILSRDGFSPDLPSALTPAPGDQLSGRMSWGLRVLMYMLRGLRIGSLDVTLPNGEARSFRGSEPGPHGVMHIRSAALVRHVLRAGEVGFGEAYLDDCWDTPDLTHLLMVLYLNEPHYKGPYE